MTEFEVKCRVAGLMTRGRFNDACRLMSKTDKRAQKPRREQDQNDKLTKLIKLQELTLAKINLAKK